MLTARCEIHGRQLLGGREDLFDLRRVFPHFDDRRGGLGVVVDVVEQLGGRVDYAARCGGRPVTRRPLSKSARTIASATSRSGSCAGRSVRRCPQTLHLSV